MNTDLPPVSDVVLGIWKDFDPVEGYAAGFDDCRGKLFIPTNSATAEILGRIKEVTPRLQEIEDKNFQSAVQKLLDSIVVAMTGESPDEQVLACSLSVWYTLLKGEQNEGFVIPLLEQIIAVLRFEQSRLKGQQFSGEVSKACVDACSFLRAVLRTLDCENQIDENLIDEVRSSLRNYRALFTFTVKDPGNFEELFSFFEKNSRPARPNNDYPAILNSLFDYGADVSEIRRQTEDLLERELSLAKSLIPKLPARAGVAANASLGAAYASVTKAYAIKGSVLAEATKMMTVINAFIDLFIQDLGRNPDILPEPAPKFLEPLITSGATVPLNYAAKEPKSLIYVNEQKNKSWLTLLNVLVHEASHAYHPLILAKNSSVPVLLKLKNWLSIPFSEATAFHRELELFEAVHGESTRAGERNRIQQQLVNLFDSSEFNLDEDVIALEFETRYWRIIRALRTLCDVRLNTGESTYVEFLNWASAHTGFDKKLINAECFTFLTYPGYTPSYSFCGLQYEDLEQNAAERGLTKHSFNTEANRIGLWPWTLSVKQIEAFVNASVT